MKKHCINCNKLISREAKRCRKCKGKIHSNLMKEFWKNKSHHWLVNGRCLKKYYCIDCEKRIGRRAIRCKKCSNSMEHNTNWQEGKSFEPYALGWNNTYKEQVRFRDGYKCRLCKKPEIENRRKLDIHHIDYDKKNIDIENLISLCHSCHMKTNFNREYWKVIFIANVMEIAKLL